MAIGGLVKEKRQIFKVLITANSFGTHGPAPAQALEETGAQLIYMNRPQPWRQEELVGMVEGIDAMIIGADHLTGKVIDAAGSLKIIAKHGVGLDNIDMVAATRSGIMVTAGLHSNTVAVAEMTVSLMFALARNIIICDAEVRDNKWNKRVGIELTGKTAGIVGLGCIGKEVALRLKGLKMEVIAFDPYWDEAFAAKYDIRYADIKTLAAESDVVTLHAPLLPETRHIIDSNILDIMKEDAILINTARGGLVDEASLFEALSQKKIYGAAIDAFSEEPPTGCRLLELPNFIATPHIGAYTGESINNMSCQAAFSIRDFINRKVPENLINKEVIDNMKGWVRDV